MALVMLKVIIILLYCVIPFSLQSKGTLEIEIVELRNNKGCVLLELLDDNDNSIKGIRKQIVNNTCLITITDLPAGTYVFKYFHDENNNEEIDSNWIGIPKEGFGFSNNAKGTFGPPKQEKMIFKFSSDTTMICNPQYLKK
ncbi:DUF2141 domain-containing protein [Puteibacter caeruleilacunae]|nr:DUF2141 domain-containing protein [Puteibacter caeruleilacunae]